MYIYEWIDGKASKSFCFVMLYFEKKYDKG